jgi:hypothetical protein
VTDTLTRESPEIIIQFHLSCDKSDVKSKGGWDGLVGPAASDARALGNGGDDFSDSPGQVLPFQRDIDAIPSPIARTMSFAASRAVLRQSTFTVRRAGIRNASTTSEAAGAVKEKAAEASSKASEGLTKVTSSASSAASKAGSAVTNAAETTSQTAGGMVGRVQGQWNSPEHRDCAIGGSKTLAAGESWQRYGRSPMACLEALCGYSVQRALMPRLPAQPERPPAGTPSYSDSADCNLQAWFLR